MMKIRNKLFSLMILMSAATSFAEGGHVGGGDQCKNTVDQFRRSILGWIQRDEAKDLNLKLAKIEGITYNEAPPAKSYKTSMLDVLHEGKVIVTCYLDPSTRRDARAQLLSVNEGVSYKTVAIGNPPLPTTCINYEDTKGVSHIDCNYDLIMNPNSLGDPDYVTVHHEFASIAGLEKRSDNYGSDFSISNQVSQFEHWAQVILLGPKNQNSAEPFCLDKIIDFTNALTTQCFIPAQRILTLPSSGAENSRTELVSEFRDCMVLYKNAWKAGFGKTCSGPEVQTSCINRCRDMGLLPYCFDTCGVL